MNPSISVVIPAYNRSNVLRLVIESVLAQTVPVQEIIVIDDGSSDDTAEMVCRHIAENISWSERVQYHYQSNQGQSAALNNGIARSQGTWIAFTAQDDIWLPWKIEWQLKAIQKHPHSSLCFTDAYFMNNPYMKKSLFDFVDGDFTGAIGIVKEPARLIVGKHPVWTQTMLARADVIGKIGGLDPYLRYSEDHDFLFRMALETEFCFVGIPLVLIDRSPADERHTGEGRNWHKEEFCLQMDQHRYEKQLQMSNNLPRSVQKMVRRNLRNLHSCWANWHLERGNVENARSSVRTAASYGIAPGLIAKRALMFCAPTLAAAIVRWDRGRLVRHDRTSWQLDTNTAKEQKPAVQ